MKNLISNALGINGFVILNKAVIKALGMHEAVDKKSNLQKMHIANSESF